MKADEAAKNKTNAMRILDRHGLPYRVHVYDASNGQIDGLSVAQKIKCPLETMYKTLVTRGSDLNYYVFVVPVAKVLDLKRAAKASGVKAVEMIPVADINRITGYVRGGCSPVGMKKSYLTVVDTSCLELEKIVVSAGRIGLQIELSPRDLIKVTGAQPENIATD